MSLWLTREELCELTGYKTKSKWRVTLAAMNLRFRVRPDGFPLVDRSQFTESASTAKHRGRGINWAAIK